MSLPEWKRRRLLRLGLPIPDDEAATLRALIANYSWEANDEATALAALDRLVAARDTFKSRAISENYCAEAAEEALAALRTRIGHIADQVEREKFPALADRLRALARVDEPAAPGGDTR